MSNINSLKEACTWSSDIWCKLGSLLGDENQWITWALVIIGWIAGCGMTYYQLNKDDSDSAKERHNEWIGEFREKLELLEDFALEFWAEHTTKEPTIALSKIQREIKSLTTSAREISACGGSKYQPKLFKDLRQAMTSDTDIANRPLPPNSYQVRRIRETCSSLRQCYSRKN
ncbi:MULTISPECIES: hypothetical protein [Pantoea]|uniref:hypothetical protein n=1 Tax=Pantoea TaxID=53335 RepID=UPI000FD9241A|nr:MULTISPECIES: hypothetical protein [Pantoea]